MRALGFLMILVAIWLIVNAVNLREVIQGKAHFNVAKLPNAKPKAGA